MSEERKRIEKKPFNPIIPKKRIEGVPIQKLKKPIVEKPINVLVQEEQPIEVKLNNKYVKIAADSKAFNEVGDKIQKGELKWSYYSMENDKGYHFYLELKKQTNDFKRTN